MRNLCLILFFIGVSNSFARVYIFKKEFEISDSMRYKTCELIKKENTDTFKIELICKGVGNLFPAFSKTVQVTGADTAIITRFEGYGGAYLKDIIPGNFIFTTEVGGDTIDFKYLDLLGSAMIGFSGTPNYKSFFSFYFKKAIFSNFNYVNCSNFIDECNKSDFKYVDNPIWLKRHVGVIWRLSKKGTIATAELHVLTGKDLVNSIHSKEIFSPPIQDCK